MKLGSHLQPMKTLSKSHGRALTGTMIFLTNKFDLGTSIHTHTHIHVVVNTDTLLSALADQVTYAQTIYSIRDYLSSVLCLR